MSIKVAVVGYGNIGKYAVEAFQAAPTWIGAVRRDAAGIQPPALADIPVVTDIEQLAEVDVALICTPTRLVPTYAAEILAKGINTVDSYDVHGQLVDVRRELEQVAVKHNSVAVISAGWDPGTDSLIRGIFAMMAPRESLAHFGQGMSMGHTVSLKPFRVENALSVTIPAGTGIHRRLVYVQLAPGANFESVKQAIKQDPYFVNDETHVYQSG